jgi:penicillin amidase
VHFDTQDWLQEEGPSYRATYDLSALETSVFVLPMGESGNLFSRQYDNLLDKWEQGEYAQMKTRDFEVASTLTLLPAQ